MAALSQAQAQVYGLYVNELIVRLLPPGQASPYMFELYVETLMKLCEPTRQKNAMRRFEVGLLKTIGHGLPFIAPRNEFVVDPQSWYCCYPYAMPVPGVPPASEKKRHYYRGHTLRALQSGLAGDIEEDVLSEAGRLLDQALKHCLGGKRLRSRRLFDYLL